MTEPNQKIMVSEICTIRIAFPVESDEQAISYRAKIKEMLSAVPNAQVNFSIVSTPQGMTRPLG